MIKGIKKKIDLGVAVITVDWLDDASMKMEAECEADEDAPDGLWDVETNRILLHKRLKTRPQYARQIYLHEISHAALDLYHSVV